MKNTTRGAIRSKTIWLGFAVTMFGYLQANIHTLAPWVDQKYIGLTNMLLGMTIMAVRFYTDQSLAAKGEASTDE